MIDIYLDALDLAYFEATVAFEGLADDNVWKRPADGLVSIGELAGRADLAKCRVKSPLVDRRFSYYPMAVPPSDEHLAMSAKQVLGELMRVHKESVAHLRSENPDLDAPTPGWFPNSTIREMLKYQIFHVSYHTGQMYSARHLLGDQPPDN